MASTIERAKKGYIGIFTKNYPIVVIFSVLSSKHLSIFMT